MEYPSHDVYATLYQRYLKPERTQELISSVPCLQGKTVVDLCGGGGRLSRAALAAGAARVLLVDESAPMTCAVQAPIERVLARVDDDWLNSQAGADWDAVFCQQAVNYWLTAHRARLLARCVREGGTFVFNTFNREPSTVPNLKQYSLQGRQFVEASWLTRDAEGVKRVEHVQMCEGEPAHVTSFRWISPQEYRQWLGADFEVHERVDGPASVWVCRRVRAA